MFRVDDIILCKSCGHQAEVNDEFLRRWEVIVSAEGRFLSDPRLRIRCSACGARGGEHVIIKNEDGVRVLGGQDVIDREWSDKEWEREQERQREAWSDRYGLKF